MIRPSGIPDCHLVFCRAVGLPDMLRLCNFILQSRRLGPYCMNVPQQILDYWLWVYYPEKTFISGGPMPDKEVKTLRDLIFYQYAKIMVKAWIHSG